MRDFFTEANYDTCDEKCDTCDAAFLELFLLNLSFFQEIGMVLLVDLV